VNYQLGCGISSNSTAGFTAACQAAQSSDATVLVMGIDQSIEAEGLDRYQITFPGVQETFIQRMVVCTPVGNPIVVVLMSGGPVDLTSVKQNSMIGSILWVGYPGQSGGQAIADVLFGAYNPGGRMAYTIYEGNYVNQISMFDMNMRPNVTSPGRSYRFYTGTPVYPFGHGLSYTTFEYEYGNKDKGVVVKKAIVEEGIKENKNVVSFEIIVKNVGEMAGSDSVLAFVVGPNAGKNGNPLKSLVDFERVFLRPGQNTTVVLGIAARDLTVVSGEGKRSVEGGVWTIVVGDKKQEFLVT